MAGETYTTTQLIDVLRKKMKFKQVFMSLFFRETFLFSTQKVDLAEIPGDVDMAVYVSPTVGSKVLRTRGGLTKQFQPGYVKPK
ncbi:major capsid protein, partial [Pseudocitrobacter vendiensis]|uniref:major capsid protein n=1 Tax=Pseudocitrobacter vendiensis TaxID=2488306 RepID=UPI0020A4E173